MDEQVDGVGFERRAGGRQGAAAGSDFEPRGPGGRHCVRHAGKGTGDRHALHGRGPPALFTGEIEGLGGDAEHRSHGDFEDDPFDRPGATAPEFDRKAETTRFHRRAA